MRENKDTLGRLLADVNGNILRQLEWHGTETFELREAALKQNELRIWLSRPRG